MADHNKLRNDAIQFQPTDLNEDNIPDELVSRDNSRIKTMDNTPSVQPNNPTEPHLIGDDSGVPTYVSQTQMQHDQFHHLMQEGINMVGNLNAGLQGSKSLNSQSAPNVQDNMMGNDSGGAIVNAILANNGTQTTSLMQAMNNVTQDTAIIMVNNNMGGMGGVDEDVGNNFGGYEGGVGGQAQPPAPPPAQPLSGVPIGFAGPEKCMLIQQQLILLLHSHKCNLREMENPNIAKCTIAHCKTMKEVLGHMTNCNRTTGCTVAHCSSSRQIIQHWKNCTRDNCRICAPLKQSLIYRSSNNAVAATTPINRTATMGSSMMPQLNQSNIPNSVYIQLFGNNDGPDSSSVAIALNPVSVQITKDWQKSIAPDNRNRFVHNLLKAIFPKLYPAAMLDERMDNVVSYVKKVEGDMFAMANSRSEYYHLLAEKIYKIQKELDEKRQERREMQMAPQLDQSGVPQSLQQNGGNGMGATWKFYPMEQFAGQPEQQSAPQQGSQLFDNGDVPDTSCGILHNLETAVPLQITKDWQKLVTQSLRNHLVEKLVQVMYPTQDSAAMLDKREVAKKIEEDIYSMANSRSEYHHSLAEKIYQILMECKKYDQN